MNTGKIIPLDVMFANDKGDVFDFSNVTLIGCNQCCYSTSMVVWFLSKVFNKGNPVKLLKKISRVDPNREDNIYCTGNQILKLDEEISRLEKELEAKRLLRSNIMDESKHIKHVNQKDSSEYLVAFN